MATIKLQPSGKVVLKDGKVSCGCCEVGCCMYPWRDPNGFDSEPLYSYDDAPDAISITINDELFNAEKYSESGFIAYSGSWGGGTITILEGEDAGSNWLLYSVDVPGDPSGESNTGCLIGSYSVGDAGSGGAGSYTTIVEDQFADSYTVTGPPGGAVVVTRQSLCLWAGLDTCGNEVRLEFISYAEDTDFPYWIISWLEYFGPVNDCNELDSSSGVKEPYAQGGDGIDTPVGSYGPSYSVS